MPTRRDILALGVAGIGPTGFDSAFALGANAQSKASEIDAAMAALDSAQLVELAMDLSNIPSPLGREEDVARCLHGSIKEAGLIAHLQPFAPSRSNVLGILK